jgi:malonate transporter
MTVLLIVLPIFALIFAGWLTRRTGLFGPEATGVLNRFVVYLALPALLFDIVANASWSDIWRPDFILAFGLGAAVIFVIAVGVRLAQSRQLANASVEGLNAAYANTAFVGFPLTLAVFGPHAAPLTLIASILTVCVLFAVAVIAIEAGVQTDARPMRLVGKVLLSIVRNPLFVAPVLGALVLAAGVHPPQPVNSFLDLLGAAASPCALVGLGLFLGEKRPSEPPAPARTVWLVALKLIGQPVLTWLLAAYVFRLSGTTAHVAVLLAALPTGTGPFMVASVYGREAGLTSRVVLISTIVSLVTVTLYLTFFM